VEENKKKLGVIVPYRNRREHLKEFSRRFIRYMERVDIDYELIVINQDDAKLFNRGSLLNIGFKYAENLNCDYVVFHDVDMLPIQVDYSYSDVPLHLSTHFLKTEGYQDKEVFDEYFGGVTMFPMEQFRKINGYSNKFWGWGYEDTDLLYRCFKKEIPLIDFDIENMGPLTTKALKLNGYDAYVKGRNTFKLNQNMTFFISFYPFENTYDHKKDYDNFTAFSIPGYDFSITYNSFCRYNFCTFDRDNNALYVNSKIKTNYSTNLCVVIDNVGDIINVYQDGYLIGQTRFFKKIRSYENERYFYLGAGNPKRDDLPNSQYPDYFKGYITNFAVYNCKLSENEILEISKNKDFKLNQNFGNYKSATDLELYYDANFVENYKLKDLSGNLNNGKIFNCEVVDLELEKYKRIKIPHRRDSTFALLEHKENGFYKNKWKFKATRWNQLRFYNEVKLNDELLEDDGLSTLEFTEYGVEKISEKITHVNVGI